MDSPKQEWTHPKSPHQLAPGYVATPNVNRKSKIENAQIQFSSTTHPIFAHSNHTPECVPTGTVPRLSGVYLTVAIGLIYCFEFQSLLSNPDHPHYPGSRIGPSPIVFGSFRIPLVFCILPFFAWLLIPVCRQPHCVLADEQILQRRSV